MTRPYRAVYRSALPAIFMAIGVALSCPAIALATDLPIYGGLGGNDFRAECPKGSYLVGLIGKAHAWVDRIAPICAPWVRSSQTLGAASIGPAFGMSTGGEDRQASCLRMSSRGNRHAIQSWWVRLLRSDDHYVQSIQVYCTSLTAPVTVSSGWRMNFGTFSLPPDAEEMLTTDGPFPPQPPFQACPGGEVAVGIRVRAGQFVDAVGLICSPVPTGAPATKVDPRVLNPGMPTPDMLVIVKPLAGDKVPHGQLVIFAAPPKAGSADVVDLELRYLDAPAPLQHSYPYTTVFSVTKAQLLDGYPVTERVTGGYVGRWQVRARSSMTSMPGPWSLPVQFQMVKAQPPPPMAQTPKLNAPITQSPAPGSSVMQAPPPSSAPAQIKSSPFMVRPRGLEEKGGKEGNQTVD